MVVPSHDDYTTCPLGFATIFERTGDFLKVPEPRKLKSGTWFIQLRLGGESIPVTASTKTACRNKAEGIKGEYKAGKRAEKVSFPDVTLRQGIDHYIEARKNDLSPATIRAYRTIQRTRFQTYMDKPMKSIKNWQKVYDSQVGDLSGKTLKNSWSLVRSVYRFETGQPMKEISMIPVVSRERQFLDADQIAVFLQAVKGHKCEIPSLLALSSMRCSELLAVKWENVDLEHKMILVSGAMVPDEHNKLIYKETNKNAASRRYVPIFISQLQTALESVTIREGFVSPLRTQQAIIRNINSVCKEARLPQIGIHGLRHSFASLCVHLGLPEETAMRIGGWSDFTTMRKIYTHVSGKDLISHTEKLQNFYQNANKNANQS